MSRPRALATNAAKATSCATARRGRRPPPRTRHVAFADRRSTGDQPATPPRVLAGITRVLKPGGTYFAQHRARLGDRVVEYFLGPQPQRTPTAPRRRERRAKPQAGVIDTRLERLCMEVPRHRRGRPFLRKVIWDRCPASRWTATETGSAPARPDRGRSRFVPTSRSLIEAAKPA